MRLSSLLRVNLWCCNCSHADKGSHGLQEITLHEALCGASFNITHLDGRVLQVEFSSNAFSLFVILWTFAFVGTLLDSI